MLVACVVTLAVISIALMVMQIFLMQQIQLLVNKVMSGDYHSYMRTESPKVHERVPLPQDPPEDLRILQEFQLS